MGGNCLLKLNIDSRPIANKYREGKVKRTLERELKVSEIAEREANETSLLRRDCFRRAQRFCFGTVRVVAAFEADACCVSCDLCQRALDDLIHLLNADVPCWVRRSGSVLFL